MRRKRLAIIALFVAGCGGRTGLDMSSDAAPIDAAVEGEATTCDQGLSPCDAGCCIYPELALGGHETCLRRADESVVCWGQVWGLDPGSTFTNVPTTTSLLTVPVRSIAIQGYDGCIVDNARSVSCWGPELTMGSIGLSSVAGLDAVTQISIGGGFACAIMTSGALRCWGDNYFGTLGDGTTINRSAAHDVARTLHVLSARLERLRAGAIRIRMAVPRRAQMHSHRSTYRTSMTLWRLARATPLVARSRRRKPSAAGEPYRRWGKATRPRTSRSVRQ